MMVLSLLRESSTATRREDRDGNSRTGAQGQVMQVVPAVERIGRRPGVRVQIDRRAKDRDVALRIDLHPARTSRRDHRLDARRRTREAVRNARPELAGPAVEGEAEP